MRISDWSSDVCSSDLVDIAKPGMAFAARPVVHVVEELAAALARPGCRNGAHDAPALHDAGEQPEARSTEMIGDVDDLYRVAQVRLVIAVFQHQIGRAHA